MEKYHPSVLLSGLTREKQYIVQITSVLTEEKYRNENKGAVEVRN